MVAKLSLGLTTFLSSSPSSLWLLLPSLLFSSPSLSRTIAPRMTASRALGRMDQKSGSVKLTQKLRPRRNRCLSSNGTAAFACAAAAESQAWVGEPCLWYPALLEVVPSLRSRQRGSSVKPTAAQRCGCLSSERDLQRTPPTQTTRQ